MPRNAAVGIEARSSSYPARCGCESSVRTERECVCECVVRKRVKVGVCVCDSTHAAIDKRAAAVAAGIISELARSRARPWPPVFRLRRRCIYQWEEQLSSAGINHINGFLGTDCASSQ
jgi:hypothetical protein